MMGHAIEESKMLKTPLLSRRAAFAALSVGFYLLVIKQQGRSLERREIEILDAVREPTDQ